MEKDLRGLSFPEKMEFLTLLSKHYNEEEGLYGKVKSSIIELFIKSVGITLEESDKEDLTDKEMLDLMYEVFTLDYIDQLKEGWDSDSIKWVETWIGLLVGVIENDIDIMTEELNTLEWVDLLPND